MKAILMSIKAQHNRNIEAGNKTSELRKRIPKCDYPIKVYTYESGFDGRHKVVNEWICKSTTEWLIYMGIPAHLPKVACVSIEDISKYSGTNYDNIIEMEISELKIYDKPKELREFVKPCNWNYDCCTCKRAIYELTKAEARLFYGCDRELTHPPQSWCYVEDTIYE